MSATFTRLFENLESRVLFSMGNGSYAPLVINGTNLADTILVTQAGDVITVNVNGTVKTHKTYWTVLGATQGSVIAQYGITPRALPPSPGIPGEGWGEGSS